MIRSGRAPSPLSSGLFALLAVACSLEEGLKKTPTVLSPDQIATIEGPGTRLVSGNFHALMGRGDLLMMRKNDAAADALTVVDPQRDRFCELEGAARFARSDSGWIAYAGAPDAQGQSQVLFARGDCSKLPLVVARGTLPFAATDDAEAVLLAGDVLTAVDPENSRERVLATGYKGAERLLSIADDAYVWIVQSGTELVAFDADWHELSRAGTNVGRTATLTSPSITLFEDGPSLRLLEAPTKSSLELLTVAEDGCEPHAASNDHLTFFSPCAEGRLHSLDVSDGDVDYGVLDVTPENALPLDLGSVKTGDRSQSLFFLRDVDPATGTGALWELASPEAEPRHVADAADLAFIRAASERKGIYALVDIDAGLGRVVFIPSGGGELEEVVTRVPHTARNLAYYARQYWFFANPSDDGTFDLVRLCDFAGCSADAKAMGARFETVAQRVPESGFASSLDAEQVAVLHDVTSGLGQLSLEGGGAIADGVPQGGFAGLYPIMKEGVAYLTRFDAASGTFALEYWNRTLDARGSIAENVSEFIRADWPYMGVIYLVPSGDKAGLWYARGK
jgi:hypothetical protein